MVSVLGKNVYIDTNAFKNNHTIVNVDLCGKPWVNNSMFNAFYNCNNLTSITNINQNVTNMSRTFHSCSNLVNAPVIPNSVTDMTDTFFYCMRLVNAPVIPNSVTYMYYTFCYCMRLVNAPVIPNSVTEMHGTFHSCSNLVNVPVIPNSVTYMVSTFNGCSNLTGNIYIQSENITNASGCFTGQPQKNVYIPFTYLNGVNTKTYNSFINAGYKTDGSVNGVYLMDIDEQTSMYYCWKLYRLGPSSSPAPYRGNHYCYSTTEEPSVGDLVYTSASETAEITGYSTGDLQFTQYAEVAHYARYSDYDTTDLSTATFYEDGVAVDIGDVTVE